jgi:hypothetical protein
VHELWIVILDELKGENLMDQDQANNICAHTRKALGVAGVLLISIEIGEKDNEFFGSLSADMSVGIMPKIPAVLRTLADQVDQKIRQDQTVEDQKRQTKVWTSDDPHDEDKPVVPENQFKDLETFVLLDDRPKRL